MPGPGLDKAAAQEKFLELRRRGHTVQSALDKIGRSMATYESWRRESKGKTNGFAALADQAQALRQPDRDVVRGERLDFAEFRRKYLKTETYWHQLQWVDMLEGRPPRDLHDAQTYAPGKRNRLLINCPPFHAKSMTLTVDYSVYRLCMDPSFRILVVSAGMVLAEDFLYAVKQRLTSPEFLELQKAYAPDGGWEATSESWTNSRIVFGTDVRAQGSMGSTAEKDPNFQAIGMGSKVYGKRADLIIVDDAVDSTNVSAYEKQRKWLFGMLASRLEAGGKLLVIGTRIASVDLYSDLMNEDNYGNGKAPWTHLASPAILEEGETPDKHVTLWPWADRPWVDGEEDIDECLCEGADPACATGVMIDGKKQFPRWNGYHLEIGPRAENDPASWALVYMQSSVEENSTFPAHAIAKSTNRQRQTGLLRDDQVGHPLGGMRGRYVIAACDPSIKGYAGIVVLAVDRDSERRYLLNCWNLKAPTPAELKSKMQWVTDEYQVNEWRVEKTGLLQFFTQDEAFRLWFTTRGVLFKEHQTDKTSKWDPQWGVASMAPLFGVWEKATESHGREVGEWREVQSPLIEFPKTNNNDALKALVHQLVIWTPHLDPKRTPCDLVMALWFASVGAKEFLRKGTGGSIRPFKRAERFLPRGRKNRTTVRVADLRNGLG